MQRERNPDVWFRLDYPVLLAIGRWSQDTMPGQVLNMHDLARRVGTSPEELPSLLRSVSRLLDGGLIDARMNRTQTDTDYMVLGLTTAGLEATGAWPRPADLAEDLQEFLEEQAEVLERTGDHERASKLRTIAKALVDVGTYMAAKVAVGMGRAALGLP